jgi:hypothetical protein
MIVVEYGAVIEPSLEISTGHIKKPRFSANHSAVFKHNHQTTEFCQTTV